MKLTPKTYSKRHSGASKLPWTEYMEVDAATPKVSSKDSTKRELLANRDLYMNISPRDSHAVKGMPLMKSTLSLLAPGQKGKLVDWSLSKEKRRKYLNHPLSKQFDGMSCSIKQLRNGTDPRTQTVEPSMLRNCRR